MGSPSLLVDIQPGPSVLYVVEQSQRLADGLTKTRSNAHALTHARKEYNHEDSDRGITKVFLNFFFFSFPFSCMLQEQMLFQWVLLICVCGWGFFPYILHSKRRVGWNATPQQWILCFHWLFGSYLDVHRRGTVMTSQFQSQLKIFWYRPPLIGLINWCHRT